MNLRSFADLDDIIIDNNLSHDKDETFLNSSYDEDVFESDSPAKEQLQSSPIDYGDRTNYDGTFQAAPDYAGDYFEADEDHTAELYMDYAGKESSGIASPDLNDTTSAKQILPVGDIYSSTQVSVPGPSRQEILRLDATVHSEFDSQQNAAISLKASPTAPEVLLCKSGADVKFIKHASNVPIVRRDLIPGKYLGNRILFSSVRQLSEDDTFMLNQRRKQKAEREKKAVSISISESHRQDIVESLEEMLLVAAAKMDKRNASVNQAACRATRAPTIKYGGMNQDQVHRIMSCPESNDVFGIPDYDPDYDIALEMKEEHLFSYPIPLGTYRDIAIEEEGQKQIPNYSDEGKDQKPGKINLKSFCAGIISPTKPQAAALKGRVPKKVFSDTPQRVSNIGERFSNIVKCNSLDMPVPNMPKSDRSPAAYDGPIENLLTQIREGKVSSDLLRLGVDRSMLATKAEDIHCVFLSDLLGELTQSDLLLSFLT